MGKKGIKKLAVVAGGGTFLTVLLASVMTMVMVVSLVSVGSKQETEKKNQMMSSNNVLTGLYGLSEFSYFCIYEGGGELYNSVMGDGGRGCGAYGFDYQYDLQPFLDYCYGMNPVKYVVFYPFTSSQCTKENLKGNQSLANAWHSAYAADPQGFSAIQDQYVLETKWAAIEAYHKQRGLDLSSRPDAIKGLCTSIHNRKGYETSQYSYITKSGVTNDTSDENFVVMLCNSFGSRGGYIYERYCVDYSNGACALLCEKNMVLAILRGEFSQPGSGGETLNNVPYFNQGDYAHVSFNGKTVKSSGCGITSFSMVVSYYLGRTITPEETAPWAMAHGANTVQNWGSFKILADHYGITMEQQCTGPSWGGSADPIVQALSAGKLVIASHTGGYFNPSNGGHYIVYTGITEDGKITVNDPGNRAKTQESVSKGGFDQTTAFSHCKQYWIFSK